MSETRPPYQAGPPATYKITLSYQLTYAGEQAVVTQEDVLLIEAQSATDAALQALGQLQRFKPGRATVTQITMVVSLDI